MSNHARQIRSIYDSSMKRLEEGKKVKESWRSEERGLWRYLTVLCTATLGFSVSLYDPIKFQNTVVGSYFLKSSWFLMILCIAAILLYLYIENWVNRELDTINTLFTLDINDAQIQRLSGNITAQDATERFIAAMYFSDDFSKLVNPGYPSVEYTDLAKGIADANRQNLKLTTVYRPDTKSFRSKLKKFQTHFKIGSVSFFVVAYLFLAISFALI